MWLCQKIVYPKIVIDQQFHGLHERKLGDKPPGFGQTHSCAMIYPPAIKRGSGKSDEIPIEISIYGPGCSMIFNAMFDYQRAFVKWARQVRGVYL
jgi:hypothetical protein